MAHALSGIRKIAALRFRRLALSARRISELSETPVGRARLWRCLLTGLLEYYLPAARTARLHRVVLSRRGITRTLHLRANGTDIYTFYAVFIRGIYDAALPLPPGATILDLGANIGLTSVYLAMNCENARIVAVEPEASNLMLIRMNLRGIRASIHHAAVSDRSGAAFLEVRGPTAHTIVRADATPDQELQKVPALTLDDIEVLEGLDRVSVVKADIEGAETRVFTRAWSLLERCDIVMLEIHVADERGGIVTALGSQGFTHELGLLLDLPDVFRRIAVGTGLRP